MRHQIGTQLLIGAQKLFVCLCPPLSSLSGNEISLSELVLFLMLETGLLVLGWRV